MALAYSSPILPPTAPLRLTPKSSRPRSPPTSFSPRTSSFSPTSIKSLPLSPVQPPKFKQCRPPTPPLPKRMKSTPVFRQIDALPCENVRKVMGREVPIVTPKVGRQGRVGRLSGRLGGLVLSPRKGRVPSLAESGIHIEISTSQFSSKPKLSSPVLESTMEDTIPPRAIAASPTPSKPVRRRWPFTSSSFWPRAPHSPTSNPLPESPRSSSDTSLSSEEIRILTEKGAPMPIRGILKNTQTSSHQRSISAPLLNRSTNSDGPNPPTHSSPAKCSMDFASNPAINVTLPARDKRALEIMNEDEDEMGERDRSMSELFEGLFILSSGGKRSSSVSLSAISNSLDAPHVIIEQEEEDFDNAEVASRDSSSFETSGVHPDYLATSRISTHRLSSVAPSVFAASFPWAPESTDTNCTLRTKRSSCALPQTTRGMGVLEPVTEVTQIPSPPATPSHEDISPIEEGVDADIQTKTLDIRTSEDGKLDVSAFSDDQWTLQADSVNDESIGQRSKEYLPLYSQLHSPSSAIFSMEKAILPLPSVTEHLGPGTGPTDKKYTMESEWLDSPYNPKTLLAPHTRSSSLSLPSARPLRSILRTDLLNDERASQQWDREKVNHDVQKVVQRLRWDKAQKAWQLVREAEHTPLTYEQIMNTSRISIARNQGSLTLPPPPTRTAMLPPGNMAWAIVDSATSAPNGQPGLVYRLCIAWHVATQYNTVNHPFGAQEEIKVFVLGRTHQEFYQLYEGLMERFMLEPRRHAWTREDEVGPRARAALEPMERPSEEEYLDFSSEGDERERVREIVRGKVDALEAWTQGLMKLKGTKMGYVLESDFVRMWMAPRREGDCERVVDHWRKDGHGEIGRDSEGIARVLERLW